MSRSTGAASNAALSGTQQQHTHQLVHREAADAATENRTQVAICTIICKTEGSKNRKQHAIECEYIHIAVISLQQTIQHTAGICSELCDRFIAACKEKLQWSTMAFVPTVREIKHHDVVGSPIFGTQIS